MRLYRYAAPEAAPRLAVAHGDGDPIDLINAWVETEGPPSETEMEVLSSTLGLIEAGPEVWAIVERVAAAGAGHAELALGDGVRFLCPLDRLASLKDFLAFEDHVKGGAERRGGDVPPYWYDAPVYYKGNHREVIGPDDECPWPDYTEWVDFELELAMIVGRPGRNVGATDAADHIFGFTVFDDFSARDIQVKEMSAWLGPGKGKDFANGFGPCIVTADEVGPEPDLEMICRVNGEEWGRARSSEMHWRWADMIAHISRAESIYPGDVFGSGTPGGCCGLDQGRVLQPGDVVELEIEKIGILRNPIGGRSTSQ